MLSFAIEAALMIFASAAGAGLTFLLCRRAPVAPESNKEELAKQSLAHLHDLTKNVAADVGAHSDRVQAINKELADGEQTSDSVLSAMSKLIEANDRMQKQLESAEDQIQQQARQMQSFEAEARTDGLTGIANRRAFDDFTRRQQSEFQRHGRPVSVLMMDVDHFKKFNDTHGHQAGDEVLKGVARVLTEAMRDVDLVARYGGEEFAVVFPGEKVRDCGVAAERAREAIESAVFKHDGIELKVTASFGLADLRAGETIAETVKRADDALYASKKAGRNHAHWHDGEDSHPVTPTSRKSAVPQPAPAEAAVPAVDTKPMVSHIDEFTGLSNRATFTEDVSRRVAEWQRTAAPLSLVLVGIDDLPGVVKKHGEASRAVVLKAATQFLKAAMRQMDHVARYDDDVFGLLLPSADLASAQAIAGRLRQAIGRCALPMGASHLRFTVSLGVAEAGAGDGGDELMRRTEQTLTAARTGGSNRTFVHKAGKAVPAENPPAVEASGSPA